MPLIPIDIKQKAILDRLQYRHELLVMSCVDEENLLLFPVTASEYSELLNMQSVEDRISMKSGFKQLLVYGLPLIVVSK